MDQLSKSPSVHHGNDLHNVSVIFASLACLYFLAGSIFIYLSWLSPTTVGASSSYSDEGSFIATLFFLVGTTFLFWLFGTIALLLGRRWVMAALLLPVAIALFIGCYLFLVFIALQFPGGPKVSLLLLLVPLNALLCGLTWSLVIRRPRW